jgi:hypothetical protein
MGYEKNYAFNQALSRTLPPTHSFSDADPRIIEGTEALQGLVYHAFRTFPQSGPNVSRRDNEHQIVCLNLNFFVFSSLPLSS